MPTINFANGNTLLSTGAFPPVRAVSTGSPLNPATGGLLVVDGVQLAAGDRVLCKDETSAINNGIYAVATGPWTRTTDAQSNTQFFQGMTVTAGPQGAVNAGQTFVCTCTDDPVVVGTSQITWASQSAVQTQQQTATSTTSLTIGTGSQTLAIQAGKAFQVNQEVLIYETSNTANSMLGQMTAYAGTSLTVNVTNVKGSGTHADWTVVLYNSAAAAGITPPIGVGDVTGPGSATDGNVVLFNGVTGKLIKDGGPPVGGVGSITPVMLANAAMGFALGMFNGKIVTSEAANALTIAIKTLAGTDPTSTDAVFFFVTDGAGGWTPIKLITALSLTVPAGATLGTVNNQAGRQWIGVFNNAGTPVLGIYNSLDSSKPSPICWDESSSVNGTGITAGSTSPQIWYAASTLTGVNFRVIGFVESKQTTAGQWAQAVTAKLFGPGVPKPGERIQEIPASFVSGSTTSATPAVLASSSLSIRSAANVIRAEAYGLTQATVTSIPSQGHFQLSRGNTNNSGLFGPVCGVGHALAASANAQIQGALALVGYDVPNVAGPITYSVQGNNSLGNGTTISWSALTLNLLEIQI